MLPGCGPPIAGECWGWTATELAGTKAACPAFDLEVEDLTKLQLHDLDRFNAAKKDAGLGDERYAVARDDNPEIAPLEETIRDHDNRLCEARAESICWNSSPASLSPSSRRTVRAPMASESRLRIQTNTSDPSPTHTEPRARQTGG